MSSSSFAVNVHTVGAQHSFTGLKVWYFLLLLTQHTL